MGKKEDTRRDAWNFDYIGPKKNVTVYHNWVYQSDDSMNKTLKFAIYCLYGYGLYVVIKELIRIWL